MQGETRWGHSTKIVGSGRQDVVHQRVWVRERRGIREKPKTGIARWEVSMLTERSSLGNTGSEEPSSDLIRRSGTNLLLAHPLHSERHPRCRLPLLAPHTLLPCSRTGSRLAEIQHNNVCSIAAAKRLSSSVLTVLLRWLNVIAEISCSTNNFNWTSLSYELNKIHTPCRVSCDCFLSMFKLIVFLLHFYFYF